MEESLRRRAGFRKHLHTNWPGRKAQTTLDLVVAEEDNTPRWISKTSASIPEFRGDARDIYLRWAITINAMHVARDRYVDRPDLGLETHSIRTDRTGKAKKTVIETWNGPDAARNYNIATPLLAAYALTDLFGVLEEIIFDLYAIYLEDNPLTILKGRDFSHVRKLYHDRKNNENAMKRWENEWIQRLEKWRRNRVYDGLHKVFLAYIRDTGLRRPNHFDRTDFQDWSKTIEAIGEARNLVTHGVGTVSQRLEELSNPEHNNIFIFKSGESLEINIDHLSFVECFFDQLFNTLSISVFEKKFGPLADLMPKQTF
tara:strand:+ start:477 stop:1418 length:942 start_codon:yes stop_codon:yes gene_type:complete